MKEIKLRRALSAWPILVLAMIGIVVSLEAGCSDGNCRRASRASNECVDD